MLWMRHWMSTGLEAYAQLIDARGKFSFGEKPTLADICLIPQLYNARRWETPLSGLEPLTEIEAACAAIPALAVAAVIVMTAMLKGFGRRPFADARVWTRGRRSKAS